MFKNKAIFLKSSYGKDECNKDWNLDFGTIFATENDTDHN